MVYDVLQILKADPYNHIYEQNPSASPYLRSLRDTFPSFKLKGPALWINIISSQDCHLVCEDDNFEWSHLLIPYPRKRVFAQSLLEMNDQVALTDLVDGMNLTGEWGEGHFDLKGTNDVEWAEEKNTKTRAEVPLTVGSFFLEVDEGPFQLKDTWEKIVRSKESRIPGELPQGRFVTRYREVGDGDLRYADRVDV
jgi:hypothetical protein